MTTQQEKLGLSMGVAPKEMIASNRRAFDQAREHEDVHMMFNAFLALELHAQELIQERDQLEKAGRKPAPSDTEIGEQLENIRRTVLQVDVHGMSGSDIRYEQEHGEGRVWWMVHLFASAYEELRRFLDTEAQRTARELIAMTDHFSDPEERVRAMAAELVGHGWRPPALAKPLSIPNGAVGRDLSITRARDLDPEDLPSTEPAEIKRGL